MYLEILPTTATGQVFHNETVLCPHRGSILISARATPVAVTATLKEKRKIKKKTYEKLETTKMAIDKELLAINTRKICLI